MRGQRFLLQCLCPQIIVSYPPTKQLTSEEQDLVWKFRYYLTTQEKVIAMNILHYESD